MTFSFQSLLVVSGILALFGLLLLVSPPAFGYLLMEDLPPEWFEFFCLAMAAWLWAKAALRRVREKAWLGAALCALMGSLSAFIAGEEISWGQRIFGYETPAYFAHRNVQHELTVHNLGRLLVDPRTAGIFLTLGYGIGVPLLALLLPPFRRVLSTLHVPTPNIGGMACFGLAAWLMTMPFTATDDEVGEVFFALGFLFAGLQAIDPQRRPRIGRTVAVLAVLSVVASGLCFLKPAHREQVVNVGHHKVAQAFEGRGKRWEAARAYERLAAYWGTDWDLWTKVIAMYVEEGDLARAFDLSLAFIRTNRRSWLPFEVIARVGRTKGLGQARTAIEAVLVDEPYNDYARWALLLLDGTEPFGARRPRSDCVGPAPSSCTTPTNGLSAPRP